MARTREDIKKDVVEQLFWDARVDAADVALVVAGVRANQLFKLGNGICRSTGILPVFFGHGQDARATENGKLIGPVAGVRIVDNQIEVSVRYPRFLGILGSRIAVAVFPLLVIP